MTQAEFDDWVPGAIEAYAADHERNGSRPAGQALAIAKEEFAKLLPAGLATADHHLVIGVADDERVGLLWLYLPTAPSGKETAAFIYDVEVDEAERGKGYGRALMLAAEDFAQERGATVIKLHVFGDNSVARSLYDRLGYVTTNVNMAKPLSGD